PCASSASRRYSSRDFISGARRPCLARSLQSPVLVPGSQFSELPQLYYEKRRNITYGLKLESQNWPRAGVVTVDICHRLQRAVGERGTGGFADADPVGFDLRRHGSHTTIWQESQRRR